MNIFWRVAGVVLAVGLAFFLLTLILKVLLVGAALFLITRIARAQLTGQSFGPLGREKRHAYEVISIDNPAYRPQYARANAGRVISID
jgi:uncharacterized membrane protein YccF (DUF307 family)